MNKRKQVLEMIKKSKALRPRELEAVGISGEYLNKLHKEGILDRPARGIYTLKDGEFDENQTLLEACKLNPRGIVCLLSALQFHRITTQLPFEVWLAVEGKNPPPRSVYPPVRISRFSGPSFSYGIEEHQVHDTTIKVYSPAKTVADCFKFRNKIGIDVALEALQDTWKQKKASIDELYEAAQVCRVSRVLQPYFESITTSS